MTILSRNSGSNDLLAPREEELKMEEAAETVRDCENCHKPFKTMRAVLAGLEVWQAFRCDACELLIARRLKEEKDRETMAKRGDAFQAMIPALYDDPLVRAAAPKDKLEMIRSRVREGLGFFAVGESGQFKTTCIWNGAIRWLVLQGQRVECMTAADLRIKGMTAAKNNRLEAFLAPLKSVPWLFIDDLGNNVITDTFAELLQEILEARLNNRNRPLLVTSQYDAESLIDRFPTPEAGRATVRRIVQLSSTPVKF